MAQAVNQPGEAANVADEPCLPAEALTGALAELLQQSSARVRQLEALKRIPNLLALEKKPSDRAADIVLDYAEKGRSAAPS